MITQERFDKLLEDTNEILTQEEEFDVFEFYNKNKTIENKNKIALKNIKLIYKPSWDYTRFGSEKEDLQQEAFMALLHAVDKFDHTKKIKFSTYAFTWIESYLQKCTIDDQLIHVPFNIIWKIEKLKRLTKEYEEEHDGAQPPDIYLKRKMGIDYYELNLLRQYETRLSTFSMDYEYSGDDSTSFHNFVIDEKQNIDKLIDKLVCNNLVNEYVQKILSKDDYQLLSRKWGLNGNKPHSSKELSEIYKISEIKVNDKIKQIYRKLRVNPKLKIQIRGLF